MYPTATSQSILREDPLMPTSCPTLPRPMAEPASSRPAEKVSRPPWWLRQKGTLARLSWRPGASMMQHTTVVSSSRIAYMILDAMLLLQELGQHWQMAQAAEPKQQAAVLPSEMMAPILHLQRSEPESQELSNNLLF